MRSKLPIAALLALATHAAHAQSADDLLKQGLALYKDGKYADAVTVLAKAYAADPKPEVLFPLAQAERLSGNCPAAAAHYKKILEQVGDLNIAKLVRQNLSLCEPAEADQPAAPKCETKPSEPGPAPAVTKVTVREVGHTDQLAVISAGGGALLLGAATGLYFAASSTRDAADKAGSLGAHDTLADRADAERNAMIVTASLGAVAIGFAAYRFVTHSSAPPSHDVALVPASHGGAVWFTSRW